MCGESHSLVFKAGSNFGVDSSGNMYCAGGTVGGAKIGGSSLSGGSTASGAKNWSINSNGTATFNSVTLEGGIIGGVTIAAGGLSVSGDSGSWSINSAGNATFSNVSITGGLITLGNLKIGKHSAPTASGGSAATTYLSVDGYRGISDTIPVLRAIHDRVYLYVYGGVVVGWGQDSSWSPDLPSS